MGGVSGASEREARFLSIEPLLEDLGAFDLGGINWVIVGGESGHGARPRKSAAGRELDGRTFDEMPRRETAGIAEKRVRLGLIDDVQAWKHSA